MRAVVLLLSMVAACASAPAPAPPPAITRGPFVASLERDAKALDPTVTTPFVHRFLDATRALPSIPTRNVGGVAVDEELYYEAKVSAPLHYARPLDIAVAGGAELKPGARYLDLGYGSIGHLRLLASLGLDVTGIEVRKELATYYSAPGDVGAIAGIDGGPAGSIRLLTGFFPSDPQIVAAAGGGHALFIAKNTLKKGYIHPDRPPGEHKLIDLKVDDATFLRAVHDALRPGGHALVYNLFIPIPEDQPFKPMSDGRSPFTEETWKAAGFTLLAFDKDDTEAIQRVVSDKTIRALYTFARRAD